MSQPAVILERRRARIALLASADDAFPFPAHRDIEEPAPGHDPARAIELRRAPLQPDFEPEKAAHVRHTRRDVAAGRRREARRAVELDAGKQRGDAVLARGDAAPNEGHRAHRMQRLLGDHGVAVRKA